MKHQLLFLTCGLALNCFAEEILPPDPSEPDGIIGGHEYVDLGLPSGTLWATHDVGATSPYETGSFFAWGEVEPRENFTWESYKFFKGVEHDQNNGDWAILEDIGSNICGTEYDAARHRWGNGWRLPNEQERYELRMLCWSKYTTENGVSGVRVYGPNEHSIFLRGGGQGLWYGEEPPCYSTDSYYWVGEEFPHFGYNRRPIEPSNRAKGILVQYQTNMQGGDITKAAGICVRAVVNPKESGIDNVVSDNGKISIIYRDGNIHVNGSWSEGTISVYDLTGRPIYSGNVIEGVCQLPELSTSIYLVSFVNNGNVISIKKIAIK